MAKKKITLESVTAEMRKGFAAIEAGMERGFGAVAEDISKLATKEQIITLHTQVTGIEADIKTTKGYQLLSRVTDIEEKVFGESRG